MSQHVTQTMQHGFEVDAVTVAYGAHPVVRDVSIAIEPGTFVAIVGANGSGKSTLLRTIAGRQATQHGEVRLDGVPVRSMGARALARRVAMLPQSPTVPPDIRVGELVARGRFPYRPRLGGWRVDDERAVRDALERTGLTELAHRPVAALSGGQRQRAWIALVLAQQTPALLLDEPTAALDLAHKLDVLDLCADLHAQGTTIVAVLHDLDLAFRVADRIIVLDDGEIAADGPAASVITPALLQRAFGLDCTIDTDPESGTPRVVPRARRRGDATDA